MRRGSRWIALFVAVAGALGAPAAANGATYCVNGPCASTATTTHASLSDAIATAGGVGSPGPDRIEIGSGDLAATNAVVSAANPVEIVGAGQGVTRLIGAAGNENAVLAIEEPGASVSGLTIQLVTGSAGQQRRGLNLTRGSATRITVEPDPAGVAQGQGANLGSGASLTSSSVLLANSPGNFALSAFAFAGQTTTLEGVEVTGGTAVDTSGNDGTINARRLNVRDSNQGVRAGGTGVLNLSSSLVRVTGGAVPRALHSTTVFGESPVLNARHVTAVGDGSPDSEGAIASAATAGRSATLNLRDTLLRGFGHPLSRTASAGTANLAVSYSDFPAAGNVDSNTGGGTGSRPPGTGNLDADPLFTNAAAGDFRLLPGSPVLEAGDPAALGAEDSATDLGGAPRVADGNHDGARAV